MNHALTTLCLTAAAIGYAHTILGPDHYVPFIAMARARRWSMLRTTMITILCGIGHVVGSVVLGFIGIIAGIAVFQLEGVESIRGDIAGWLLLGFGLAYFVWGIRRAIRNKPHTHPHVHEDGTVHLHEHTHHEDHVHVHDAEAPASEAPAAKANITPWVLFAIFVFGPCEPLIPLLMFPAAKGTIMDVVIVACVFSAATITTMTTLVLIGYRATGWIPTRSLERYSHALAGFALVACGAAIKIGL